MSKYVPIKPKPYAVVMRRKKSSNIGNVLEYVESVKEGNQYIKNIKNKDPDYEYELAEYV